MLFAGETACATNGKFVSCIDGACFSLPTPACGRIFFQLLTVVGPEGSSRGTEPAPVTNPASTTTRHC
jgi:hypothetical protein